MTPTLDDAKDQVAKTIYSYSSWKDFVSDAPDWRTLRDANDEAAEVYAQQRVEAALKEYKEMIQTINTQP